jgi:hypothetical protein
MPDQQYSGVPGLHGSQTDGGGAGGSAAAGSAAALLAGGATTGRAPSPASEEEGVESILRTCIESCLEAALAPLTAKLDALGVSITPDVAAVVAKAKRSTAAAQATAAALVARVNVADDDIIQAVITRGQHCSGAGGPAG